jgi:hypothetical protein
MISRLVPAKLVALLRLFLLKESFLYSEGYLRSVFAGRPVTRDGEPLPWLTYGAIAFLGERLKVECEVFEYGCGQSTLYFQSRVSHITSVEHDEMWANEIKTCVDDSKVTIEYIPLNSEGSRYVEFILEDKRKYDLILIDGRRRVQCFEVALDAVKPDGVIVFDDADRNKYSKIFDLANERNFSQLRFWGLRPASIVFDSTVVFYRKNSNWLGL